ncbi:hypothetical protein ABW19_dt0207402 [Dactylella cylindrospora]|nr:hypothetical protein ABW19_dt0207402 [Dactylella cylindrospora]
MASSRVVSRLSRPFVRSYIVREYILIGANSYAQLLPSASKPGTRANSSSANEGNKAPNAPGSGNQLDEADSAMRRRLEDLEEQSQLAEPRRHIEAATPSPETDGLEALKARLADKIQSADYNNENAGAISYSRLSGVAGKETSDTALARPWTGTESLEDAVLRSLHEAKPRLRGTATAQTTRSARSSSIPTNLAPMRKMSVNERIVSARDRAGAYPLLKKAESELNDEEKEARARMFKERFEPAARAMPNTVQGLAALANERIDEAIAKGLFKNLPKGPIERDHHAESPFIDTTEYILNRMIQRQEIVPPWIEKQQELQREIKAFRSRLRQDWKRHVVRTIASWGGSPDVWIKRAEDYAKAERMFNPDPVTAYDESVKPKPRENKWKMDGTTTEIGERIPASESQNVDENASPQGDPTNEAPSEAISTSEKLETDKPSPPLVLFRDGNWEKTELSYITVFVENLNQLTRSYNLQAPRLAQRPFLVVKRELKSCYRDVMPTIPAEMIERANNPNYGKAQLKLGELPTSATEDKGFLDILRSAEKGKVYDESEEKAYGFRQFLKDLFSRP